MFEVLSDRLPQKLVWSGYGFYIEVPAGALPPGVTASVAVRAILRGQFSLPENSELISAIYWISCSEVFLRDVAVNIQCCANEEESREFKFIIAKCFQELPYKFVKRNAVFNAHTQYAAIHMHDIAFLLFGLIEHFEKQYVAQKFYKHISTSPFTAMVCFVLLANEKTEIIEVIDLCTYSMLIILYPLQCKKEMKDWNHDVYNAQWIIFKSDSITLNIQSNPPLEVDNWRITPSSTPLKV